MFVLSRGGEFSPGGGDYRRLRIGNIGEGYGAGSGPEIEPLCRRSGNVILS